MSVPAAIPSLSRHAFFRRVAVLIAVGLLPTMLLAQSAITWSTTADGNWTTGSNWGGTAPSNSLTTNYAYFNNVGSGGNTTVTIDSNRSVAGIRFGTSAGQFTLTKTGGGRTLTLGSYGILQEDDTAQTITGSSLTLTLGAASTFTISGAGGLTISSSGGAIGTTATNKLTLAGDGTGIGNISSQITGAGLLTKSGTGTWTLSSSSNNYTGGTTIAGGTLVANANNALGTSGTIKFTGGTLRYGTGITTDYSSRIANSTGAIAIDTNGNNVTFVSALANTNTGGLSKSGAGTLTLNGANNYTGGTTLNAGTLALGNNSALGTGTLTVNGGTLTASGGARTISNSVSLAADLTIGGSQDLTLSGGIALTNGDRTFTIDNTGTTTFSGGITEAWYSNITKEGNGRLVLSGSNSFSGSMIVNGGTLALTNSGALGSASWNNSVANGATLELSNNITVTENSFTIAGSGDGGAGAINNLSGTNTLSGALALGGATTINSTAGSLTLSSSYSDLGGYGLTVTGAGDTTFTGQLGSSGGTLTKSGSGTLTLSGANSYDGGTTLAAGTVVANNANALAYAGNITFTGGTLQYGTGITTDWSARIANSSSAIKIDTNGNDVTFASALANTNTGGLAKSGTGTLTLATANSYTGSTSVTGGTLQLQNSGAIGTGAVSVSGGSTLQLSYSGTNSNSNALTLNSGTLLNSSGTNSWLGTIALTGNGTIANNSASELAIENSSRALNINMGSNTLTVGGTGDTRIYSRVGVTGDTGSFVKNGSGTVTFYGYENLYTGSTTVNEGTLVLDTANSYVDKTILGSLIIGDGTHSATVLYGTGSANDKIKDTSTVTINAGGLLDLNGRRDTIGALVMNGGTIDTRNDIVNSKQGTLTLAGDVTVGGSSASTINGYQFSLNDQTNAANIRNFTVADATGSTASDLTINSQVVFGGINKLGLGTMTLTGDNTYGETTTVTAGVLNIRSNTALGATAGGTSVSTNAALELQNDIHVGSETLTLAGDGFGGSGGALRNVSGSNIWDGSVILSQNARITTDAGSTLTLNGAITGTNKNLIFESVGDTYATNAIGTGTGTVTKTGAGTLYLSGNSTYQGATTISQGVVNISSNDALGSTLAGTSVASGAALQLQNNITVGGEALALSGTGVANDGALRNISGNNTYGGLVTASSANVRVNSDSGTLTLSGGIAVGSNSLAAGGASNITVSGALTGSSGGMLTKDGSGTLTISSANNNSFASDITLTSGTLLMAANNALNNAAVDVAVNGGTFSLQTYAQSIGALTGTGEVSFASGSSLTLQANSLFSGTFTGTGTVVVSSGVTLTLGADFNAAGITIVLAGGTLALNGHESTFAGLSLTGNSTIDFASGADSIVHFTTLALSSYSLAVAGWADEQDYFRVTTDPGDKSVVPLNQVTFSPSGAWVGNDTIWTGDYTGYTYNDEVRPWKPVPEPSTYGAMFMGAALAFFGYRRWRAQKK